MAELPSLCRSAWPNGSRKRSWFPDGCLRSDQPELWKHWTPEQVRPGFIITPRYWIQCSRTIEILRPPSLLLGYEANLAGCRNICISKRDNRFGEGLACREWYLRGSDLALEGFHVDESWFYVWWIGGAVENEVQSERLLLSTTTFQILTYLADLRKFRHQTAACGLRGVQPSRLAEASYRLYHADSSFWRCRKTREKESFCPIPTSTSYFPHVTSQDRTNSGGTFRNRSWRRVQSISLQYIYFTGMLASTLQYPNCDHGQVSVTCH